MPPSPLHGWIVLDKPPGLGSTDAVASVKRLVRQAGYPRTKIGHGGTLDRLAHGVLPIALGEATKLAGVALDAAKSYSFEVEFGVETDTLDADGAVVATSDARPTAAQVEAALPALRGAIEQRPPTYSALKVAGRRASDRARAGEEVTLATRSIHVHELTLETFSASEVDRVRLHARVSKGTYIRALARDLAHALGTVGHVTDLQRTAAGPFRLDRAHSLDSLGRLALGSALDQAVLPLGAALDDIPALPLLPAQAAMLRRGQRLVGIAGSSGLQLATLADVPVALVEHDGAEIRVVRGFNLPDVEDETE